MSAWIMYLIMIAIGMAIMWFVAPYLKAKLANTDTTTA